MATLTIRDLDDALKLKLRLRAASQNRSMEEEARQILRAALNESMRPQDSFLARVKSRFDGLGDVELSIEPREQIREPLEIHEAAGGYAATPSAAAAPKARTARRPASGKRRP